MSNTDEKDRGWAAPSDNNGTIFTYTMLWACDPQDSTPTFDQVEHFLQFLDKYVSHAICSHLFHNGVNQIARILFWIEGLHPTLHVQFWCMKIASRCGKKSGTSRKASVMNEIQV